VLVVDDSAPLRFMLRMLLEDAGIEVEEASSGCVALARLAQGDAARPDAVIVDQRMPDLSGLDVARELRARGSHPRLLLFTSYLDPALEEEARGLGVTTLLKSELARLVAELSDEQSLAA
jgi:two-component system response regulator (stage 0 sporulation protein F)